MQKEESAWTNTTQVRFKQDSNDAKKEFEKLMNNFKVSY